MKQKDLLVLSHLRQNARIPLTILSKKTSIPVSTIFDRLRIYEEARIIRHTSLLNFDKLGYGVRASISLKVDHQDKEALHDFLKAHASVNSAYRISNGFDYFVEAVFEQIKDLDSFLDSIEKKFRVKEKQSYFIIDDVKREAFLTNEHLLPFPENPSLFCPEPI